MSAAWTVVALASFFIAALLAAVDGALLSSGYAASRASLGDPERAHRALSMARVVSHLVAGTAIALAVAAAASGPKTGVPMTVFFLLVHVLVVEGIARAAGYARGVPMILRLAPSVTAVDLLLRPLTLLGGAIDGALGRLLPPADATGVPASAAAVGRFREVVAAEADDVPTAVDLLTGAFSLGTTAVQEIMVPRVDVVGIDRTTPWTEMLDRVRVSEHARFPVYDETLDNVVGILYAKDLLTTVVTGAEPPGDWAALTRPATFIPATKTLDQQLRDFKAQRTHIALVLDEYGGMQGLVTIEDILEEVVGEIRDEFDVEEPTAVQEDGKRFWVSGGLSLGDLSELLGTDLHREQVTTVGGLVYATFGRVPRAGDSQRVDGFRVVVERVRRRRVERVYFERIGGEHDA